jgi:hypothetical protein
MKKRSAHMKDLGMISGMISKDLGVMNFSYDTSKKLDFYELDAFPKGICSEGNGLCCWRYSQLSGYMVYGSQITRIKANDGNYYRTCFACENERHGTLIGNFCQPW